MSGIKLIVGLGNPGAEYANTRHNVGAWFVEALCHQTNTTLRAEPKFFGLRATVQQQDKNLHLLIPTTYMNESGKAVLALAKFYKLEPEEILVVHDELDFPAGVIRLKKSGGHGGHNGLRNIISQLHSADFYRLRIGINHPGHKDKVTPYVLSSPSKQDADRIQQEIMHSLNLLPEFLNGEFDKAQRLQNGTT